MSQAPVNVPNVAPWIIAADTPALPAAVQVVNLWIGFFLALVSAAGVIATVRSLWGRTVGRRRSLERDLHRVVAGGRIELVQQLFGPPTFTDDDHYKTYDAAGDAAAHHAHILTWASPDHVLRCWIDADQRILGWLVTSRASRFKPTWRIGGQQLQLHHTLLGDTGGHVDQWMRGANWFAFAYHVGGGRPLLYQSVWSCVSEERLLTDAGHLLEAMVGEDEQSVRVALEKAAAATPFDTIAVFDVPPSPPRLPGRCLPPTWPESSATDGSEGPSSRNPHSDRYDSVVGGKAQDGRRSPV